MEFAIENGQGGWLAQVSGPDELGRLGVVWTGADALQQLGVPVERGLPLGLQKAPGGLPEMPLAPATR